MFVDTHCHLEMVAGLSIGTRLDAADLGRIAVIIKEAEAQQVNRIITVGTNAVASADCVTIAQRFSSVAATVGIHPCDVNDSWKIDFEQIKKMAQHHHENKIVALGEVGLDYHHKPFDKNLQAEVFRAHLDLAVNTGLPVTLHVRDAADDAMAILSLYKGKVRGVLHCFQQSLDIAKTAVEWGLYLGITATITYPNNELLRQVVRKIPLDRLLLETDAPFLPPQAFRGKPNHPAYIPIIANEIARELKMTTVEVARVTTANAYALFSFATLAH